MTNIIQTNEAGKSTVFALLISNTFSIHDLLSTTQTDLTGMLRATGFVLNESLGVIFCDSQIALQTLNSVDRAARKIANSIRKYVYCAKERDRVTHFAWMLSHVQIPWQDHADR